jgi:hypothetical protein
MLRRMLRRMICGAVILCAALALFTATATAAPATQVPTGFVGVNVDGPAFPAAAGVNLSGQTALMRRSGVQSVRAVFSWAFAQPYASFADVPANLRSEFVNVGGVPTNFSQTDQIVRAAAAHGLTVLPIVVYAPPWDLTGATITAVGRPATNAPYAAFLRALVLRYGPHGSFWKGNAHPVPVTQWQIWNEPNIDYYWPTQPFAPTYVAMVKAAHAAIKRADPSAQVVLAGLTGVSWVALQQIYQVPGARAAFDAVAAHPYTRTAGDVIKILGYDRIVMNNHGDRAKPLIASEAGYTSSQGHLDAPGITWATTPQGQAQDTTKLIAALAKYRTTLGLGAFYLYTWAGIDTNDANGLAVAAGALAFNYAGLLHYANGHLSAKPALAAFARAALAIER